MSYITGNTGKWEYVIGLEVHAQISSKSKLFSRTSTKFGAEPNSQVSFVDAAMPGMLPVLNKYCVEQAIKTGLGVNATINKLSIFDRKNYFYADLPQGYQISQFYHPIVKNGYMDIKDDYGNDKRIIIERIHLEQDAGKSMHDQHPEYTLIDLNRAGVALMEIVTGPDISSPLEAADYIRKLRNLLVYIGSCNGNMDQGAMRFDANVSVRKPGDKLGTRCEIKNLNSIKYVIKSIEYEGLRQVDLLENGKLVEQETRLFDVNTGTTRTMRTKEDANDYRYFPDPDLMPVCIDDQLIDKLKLELPEFPLDKIYRYVSELSISQYDAEVIVADIETAQYFEEASAGANAKVIANWISSELFGLLRKNSETLSECKITPKMLQRLVELIDKGVISGKIAKVIFEEMFETGKEAKDIVKNKGLEQISDVNSIELIVEEVIAMNSDSVKLYREGKDKLFGFFVGQVMKKTSGKANPQIVNELLKKKLS